MASEERYIIHQISYIIHLFKIQIVSIELHHLVIGELFA